MTALATELAINRDNTDKYINIDPTEIILIPRREIWVAGSKRMADQTPRVPQTFKVNWQYSTGQVTVIDGTTFRFDYVIIGRYDAEVEINDHWSHLDQDFEVHYVFPSNGYEVRAGGNSYGSKPVV